MDLSRGGFRMKGLHKLVDGRQFYGMVNVNSVLRTQNDIADYLIQVPRDCFVQPGTAMVYHGIKFLLGRGVEEYSGEGLFRTLRMLEVNEEGAWTRVGDTTNALTGLKTEEYHVSLGTALICRIATANISDAFHTNDSKYMLITNSAIQVNDKVGPYLITFVEVRHGLSYAEAR